MELGGLVMNMRPSLSSTNEPNRSATYTEEWTYPFRGHSGFKKRTDCANVIVRQSVVPSFDPDFHPVPVNGVTSVIGVRPEIEMARVDAPLVIAGMQDQETGWNGAVRQFIGHTMGTGLPSMPEQGSVTSESIGSIKMCPIKLPTSVVHLDDPIPERPRVSRHTMIIQAFQ